LNKTNPSTTIKFNIASEHTESIEIEIYNAKGQIVDSILINSSTHSPIHSVTWNASGFSSGVYLYKLIADGKEVAANKMLLMK
jgi:hypothetical protein